MLTICNYLLSPACACVRCAIGLTTITTDRRTSTRLGYNNNEEVVVEEEEKEEKNGDDDGRIQRTQITKSTLLQLNTSPEPRRMGVGEEMVTVLELPPHLLPQSRLAQIPSRAPARRLRRRGLDFGSWRRSGSRS